MLDIPSNSGLPHDDMRKNMPEHMKAALVEGKKREVARLARAAGRSAEEEKRSADIT